MQGKDRVIVALDVPTHDEAVALVDALDNVSFFKVGLELFLAGDDHARWTTPADAVRQGADYLVVGRPIRTASNPRVAAQRIIDEIDEAASLRP